jgi:hypothetical protein
MADPTGAFHLEHGGKSYELRLTMRGIAKLQAKHGRNIAGMLDGTAGDIPDMMAVLDLVSEALQKGSGLSPEEADDVADELTTHDTSIVGSVVATAFPDMKEGNGKAKRGRAG